MRTVSSVLGNSQKLDGGAMFGNVPKAMWRHWVEVDTENRVTLSCRAMLVQEQGRNILFETGVGAFFEPKLKERFGVMEEEHVLLHSLRELGLEHADIDYVVLSHLHFDHAGGLLSVWQSGEPYQLLFPKAKFIVSKEAWRRASHPHARDKASFIPELVELLKESQRLYLVEDAKDDVLGNGFRFHFSGGHTPGMMLTEVAMPLGAIVFAADLIPGEPWVHVPVTMGYDRFPEQLIDEKKQLLEHLIHVHGRLFFTHDRQNAMGTVMQDGNGRYMVSEKVQHLFKLDK